MKYMVCWSIAPENYGAALDSFLEGGAPMSEGLTSLGRWHVPGSMKGWLLCATDDPVALAEHMAQWAGLLSLQVTPVVDDEVAAEAGTRCRS